MGRHSTEDLSLYPVMYFQVRDKLAADMESKMAQLDSVVTELNSVLTLAEDVIKDQQAVIAELKTTHSDSHSNVETQADQMLTRLQNTRDLIGSLTVPSTDNAGGSDAPAPSDNGGSTDVPTPAPVSTDAPAPVQDPATEPTPVVAEPTGTEDGTGLPPVGDVPSAPVDQPVGVTADDVAAVTPDQTPPSGDFKASWDNS